MAILIKSDRTWATEKNLDEWLIKTADEIHELPDTTGPGSVAYNAEMSLIAMKDEDGEWQAIVGTIPDAPTDEVTEEETDPEEQTGDDT